MFASVMLILAAPAAARTQVNKAQVSTIACFDISTPLVGKQSASLGQLQLVSMFQMSRYRRHTPSSFFQTMRYLGVTRWPFARVSVARPIS
jgi:hypothetical protein